ncbi:hypothetical protein [Levilactobacillus wangkuiensis]|uniref:hypothetical protein n=1 Tax=Levilactobacillus wangkuiensis TaxID=2799566 RepID=UPI0019404738|nr:hypothetical protein [Levilactobacillus wangkuiensis]
MQVGNKRVRKVLVGGEVVYRDSGGWIPLELPDGVNGLVFFRDNEDGTASLLGNCSFLYKTKKFCILNPPKEYAFTSFNWKSPGTNDTRYLHSAGIYGANQAVFIPEVASGALFFTGSSAPVAPSYQTFMFNFCLGYTTMDTSDSSPAIIGIEKV